MIWVSTDRTSWWHQWLSDFVSNQRSQCHQRQSGRFCRNWNNPYPCWMDVLKSRSWRSFPICSNSNHWWYRRNSWTYLWSGNSWWQWRNNWKTISLWSCCRIEEVLMMALAIADMCLALMIALAMDDMCLAPPSEAEVQCHKHWWIVWMLKSLLTFEAV